MVSMYVDIRQAAELLAKVTGANSFYQAERIWEAGRLHGLTFRGPGKTQWNWNPGLYWIATDDKGKKFIRPHGKINGESTLSLHNKVAQAHKGTPITEQDGGELVPTFTVSIAEIVKHPYFRFDAEIQEQILEAHKAAQAKPEQAPAPALDNGKPKGKDSPSWIDDAKAMAWAIIERQRARDLFPSQQIIAEEIARTWRTEGRYTFAWGYIKRHALKGITSDPGKLKQMQIRQGK